MGVTFILSAGADVGKAKFYVWTFHFVVDKGFSPLQYNHAMPVKNPSASLRAGIIPGQMVINAKLGRDKELRREMTTVSNGPVLWVHYTVPRLMRGARRNKTA
jgi:hypothetical protein